MSENDHRDLHGRGAGEDFESGLDYGAFADEGATFPEDRPDAAPAPANSHRVPADERREREDRAEEDVSAEDDMVFEQEPEPSPAPADQAPDAGADRPVEPGDSLDDEDALVFDEAAQVPAEQVAEPAAESEAWPAAAAGTEAETGAETGAEMETDSGVGPDSEATTPVPAPVPVGDDGLEDQATRPISRTDGDDAEHATRPISADERAAATGEVEERPASEEDTAHLSAVDQGHRQDRQAPEEADSHADHAAHNDADHHAEAATEDRTEPAAATYPAPAPAAPVHEREAGHREAGHREAGHRTGEEITDQDLDEEVRKDKRGISRFLQVLLAIFVPVLLVVAAIRMVASPVFLWVAYRRPGFPGDDTFSTGDREVYGSYGMDYLTNAANSRYLAELSVNGEALFTDAEVSHMTDVKIVVLITMAAGVLLLLLAVLFGLMLRKWRPGGFARGVFAGAWVVLGLMIALAVFAILAWQDFFDGFHRIFFAEGTWTFDAEDTLIRLYPEQFWIDAAIAVLALVVIMALIALIVTWPTKARRARRRQRLEEVFAVRREKLVEELNKDAEYTDSPYAHSRDAEARSDAAEHTGQGREAEAVSR
ncbi:TIGR01906 family membrane protein [Nesterenkonia aerolata]|uniref:TIGR01906 family membrane protein n=1 Tax=Nesterenkonia aerolata TaxID=3074079 RepID=A0ABU2DQV7_9MICC|nr:TIGR01906 family membrane protein [Nesterenkonia sp. LY-0111]MDR8018890.1 TIGR01906 family membrane protein [Nesterenkonia sp. LY-0111]